MYIYIYTHKHIYIYIVCCAADLMREVPGRLAAAKSTHMCCFLYGISYAHIYIYIYTLLYLCMYGIL